MDENTYCTDKNCEGDTLCEGENCQQNENSINDYAYSSGCQCSSINDKVVSKSQSDLLILKIMLMLIISLMFLLIFRSTKQK